MTLCRTGAGLQVHEFRPKTKQTDTFMVDEVLHPGCVLQSSMNSDCRVRTSMEVPKQNMEKGIRMVNQHRNTTCGRF